MQWNGSGGLLDWGLWILLIAVIALCLWLYVRRWMAGDDTGRLPPDEEEDGGPVQ